MANPHAPRLMAQKGRHSFEVTTFFDTHLNIFTKLTADWKRQRNNALAVCRSTLLIKP